jgi:hypothetical protein
MYASIADAAFRSASLMIDDSPDLAMLGISSVFYGYLVTSILAIHLRMRNHTKLLMRSQDELAKDRALKQRSFFYADYIGLFIIPLILTSLCLAQMHSMIFLAEQVEYLLLFALISFTIYSTRS